MTNINEWIDNVQDENRNHDAQRRVAIRQVYLPFEPKEWPLPPKESPLLESKISAYWQTAIHNAVAFQRPAHEIKAIEDAYEKELTSRRRFYDSQKEADKAAWKNVEEEAKPVQED